MTGNVHAQLWRENWELGLNGEKQLKTVTKRDTLGMAGKMKAVTSARHYGGKPLQAMRRGAL